MLQGWHPPPPVSNPVLVPDRSQSIEKCPRGIKNNQKLN